MICEEFRFLSVQEFGSKTTAEVAALYAHVIDCQGCYDWLRENFPNSPPTPEENEVLLRLLNDPEARSIVARSIGRRLASLMTEES